MKKLAVVAIGGNAVNRPGEEATAENMMKNLSETARFLVSMLDEYDIVITHGNGPQVGNLLVQQELAKHVIPPFPIDVNDAQTQGSLGYMIALTLGNELRKRNIQREIAAIVTQIIVDKNDPGFQKPSKPVGPFYSKEEAEKLQQEKGWIMKEDAGRGWRRVVPSPIPLDIVEKNVIKTLVEKDMIVIAAGGGGIPVIQENGTLKGVEAVIDKDRASALLAKEIDADILIILTGVEKVYINFYPYCLERFSCKMPFSIVNFLVRQSFSDGFNQLSSSIYWPILNNRMGNPSRKTFFTIIVYNIG